MQNIEILTIIGVLFFTSVLAYKSSFLHNKKIGFISLLQIFYLVLLPGFIYTAIFAYLLEILERPLKTKTLLNDKLLSSLFLLSTLYTYGGIAIHGISKTLSSYFKKSQTKSLLFQVNNYFHRQFSHNLTFIGSYAGATLLALLELNHVSPYPPPSKTIIILLNGIIVGTASVLVLSLYKKRWLELKVFFFALWLMFFVLAYAIKPYLKDVKSYPFSLSLLITFSILACLNIFLYIRKIKNKVTFIWRIPKDLFE